MDDRFRLRPAGPEDAGALVLLEERCFPDPWSEAAFALTLAGSGADGLIVESGGQLVGYILTLRAADTAEILNLAVAPEARGEGLASGLLAEAVARLQGAGVRQLYLEVRASNQPALALYRGAGFETVGRRRGYYTRPVEDALVLRRALVAAEGPAVP